jgi:hypothetical protein
LGGDGSVEEMMGLLGLTVCLGMDQRFAKLVIERRNRKSAHLSRPSFCFLEIASFDVSLDNCRRRTSAALIASTYVADGVCP